MILIVGGCGYIGSELHRHLREHRIQCDSVDLELYGNPGKIPNRKVDYRSLTAVDLAPYSHIVFLAAHSSVKMAMNDPSAAFYNNVVGFKQLLEKITPQQRLIYASSSSVYNGVAGEAVDEEWPNFSLGNIYDFSKFSNDCLANYSGLDYVALRFGTVNGGSANLRTDLMINRMVMTAMREGKVNIANSHVYRPILALRDLVGAVEAIIRQRPPGGIYNIASFNDTVDNIGRYVAKRLAVPVNLMPNSPTYDFSIKADKLQRATGFRFSETLESLVDSVVEHYETQGYEGSDR